MLHLRLRHRRVDLNKGALAGRRQHQFQIHGLQRDHGADHQNRTRAQLRPTSTTIERFGFDRLMSASDWPVSDQTHRYPTWITILDELTTACSVTEVRNLFRDNAITFYRLDR